jgi:Rps23 Pro-64 3,4-dihydroxylase Tpa1-like proline 4-hydroxylase
MHDKIYKFINDIENLFPAENLKIQHHSQQPTPFTVIDNFLPQEVFLAIVEDIKNISEDYYMTFSKEYKASRKEARNFVQAPLLQTLSNSLNSNLFINWLEKITDIKKLIPDPHLRGGGLNRVLSHDKLGLHTDFNWNDQLQLNRKVNIILYLTPNWKNEWNGALEIWNKDATKCLHQIEPIGNRLVFWNYEPWLVHGFTQPLNCPTNVSRDSLAHFYYTSNSTWEHEPSRSKFL